MLLLLLTPNRKLAVPLVRQESIGIALAKNMAIELACS